MARHVIHSTETLIVAINTVNGMMEMAGVLNAATPVASHQTQQDLAFHKQVLQNLLARSHALDGRLRNEINLVDQFAKLLELRINFGQAFNLVALRDSTTNVQIGIAAQNDSAAMRTISLVTMAFLPATFVSVGGGYSPDL